MVPEGSSECRYGQWGWQGRAVRDAPGLAVSKFAAAFVVSATTVVMGATFFAIPDTDLPTRALYAVVGFVVGTFVGVGLVALWGLTPAARRYHWIVRCGEFSQDPSHYAAGFSPSHFGLWVKSRHWHTIRNLRCTVTDPLGQTWRSPVLTRQNKTTHLVPPGESVGGFSYPNDFGAPWPVPGTYRVTWEMDAKERPKTVVLANGRCVIR